MSWRSRAGASGTAGTWPPVGTPAGPQAEIAWWPEVWGVRVRGLRGPQGLSSLYANGQKTGATGLVCESSPGCPSQKPLLKQTHGGARPPGPRSQAEPPTPLPSPRAPQARCFRLEGRPVPAGGAVSVCLSYSPSVSSPHPVSKGLVCAPSMTRLDCRDPPSPRLPHFPRGGHWLPKSCLAAHPENEDDREFSVRPFLLRRRPLGRMGVGRMGVCRLRRCCLTGDVRSLPRQC